MVQAMKSRIVIIAAAVALAAGTASAQDKHDHSHHGHDHGTKTEKKGHEGHDHAHGHAAPHGGTLVVLGDHFAHLELVLDSAKGKLTAYVLDGEAEKSVRLKQPEIEIQIAPAEDAKKSGSGDKASSTTLRLVGVGSPLTGEAVGNTSEFSAKSEKLKGVKKFRGVIREVTIKGNEIKKVDFRFPEGNE